jgi:hypothetical protein
LVNHGLAALKEGIAAQVVAVQLHQVEGEKRAAVVATVADVIEARRQTLDDQTAVEPLLILQSAWAAQTEAGDRNRRTGGAAPAQRVAITEWASLEKAEAVSRRSLSRPGGRDHPTPQGADRDLCRRSPNSPLRPHIGEWP